MAHAEKNLETSDRVTEWCQQMCHEGDVCAILFVLDREGEITRMVSNNFPTELSYEFVDSANDLLRKIHRE